jgi:hypothetical protein
MGEIEVDGRWSATAAGKARFIYEYYLALFHRHTCGLQLGEQKYLDRAKI